LRPNWWRDREVTVADRPLDGLTVVSIEQAVALPFATRLLADLGARVIKVERLDGGDFARGYDRHVRGLSSHFLWLNRSKESLAVDLKQQAGRDLLGRLVETADVFAQNLGPGAAERLGFGSDVLRTEHPALVVAAITGYGQEGPYRDRKAFDMLVQAESGLVSVTGTPEEGVKAGIPAADIAAGMFTSNAILGALLRKGRTGDGADIHVSMFDSLVEWLQHPIYAAMYGGAQVPRTGLAHPSIVPYNAYPAADGRVLIGVQNDRQWQALTAALGRDDLAQNPGLERNVDRCAKREFVDNELGRTTLTLPAQELLKLLNDADIPVAQVNELADVIDHPQLVSRGRWTQIDTEAGSIRSLLPPATFDRFGPALGPVPALGESNWSLFGELGLADSEVAALRERKVVP
jgi:crotonobetainyl-CoA:carnitine CoA-transferase CaiB-like acyl-CoA transferase